MIEGQRRLRRAVLINDLVLVQRIVRNNPHLLRNPDFEDKSNTSLHLAAKHGFVQIAEFFISTGHERDEISRNTDNDTPLMVACQNKQIDMGLLLIARFPRCVAMTNKHGLDALMLASRHGAIALIPHLLTSDPPADPRAFDHEGNTALHYASASGELKALRILLQAGASPMAQNVYSWTPISYSISVAAEVYFKNLVQEMERLRAEQARDRQRAAAGGVRLVTNADGGPGDDVGDDEDGRRLITRAGEDPQSASTVQSGSDWSPVQMRRAMTPTTSRTDLWSTMQTGRTRSSSGD